MREPRRRWNGPGIGRHGGVDVVQGIKGSTPICAVDGCGQLGVKRGWCGTHWKRWRTHGDPLYVRPRKPPYVPKGRQVVPVADRLWRKVDKNGPVPEHRPDLGPCWIWTGAKTLGYGVIQMGRGVGTKGTHILAYNLLVGEVPEGLELDHLCRVPACCNPSHLEPVPHRVNALRGRSPAVVAFLTRTCKRGHNLDIEGTPRPNQPWRRTCRACKRYRRSMGGS